MTKNKSKEKRMKQAIEHHDTAAWADNHSLKPDSKVNIPNEVNIRNAKEYVDSNQK